MISQPVARLPVALLAVVLTVGLAACGSAPETRQVSSASAPPKRHSSVGERAANIALQQVGTPYRYGGNSPRGFDCSGLVHYSYASVGRNVPRTTSGLWAELTPVESGEMRAGDLLFFSISGKMSHVGLYVGGGRFVHAPSTGKTVSVESLGSDYYRKAFIRAGRPD